MTDVRVIEYAQLPTPEELLREMPQSEAHAESVRESRRAVQAILSGEDANRRLAIVGPCSVHDVEAVLEYARQLKSLADQVKDRYLVVMRLYFQKPRTRTGWTGILDDPGLDGSYDVCRGIRTCRDLMIRVTEIGLAIATELLGTTLEPQYISDYITWGCIGARTCESQIHRHLASGVSYPVGFKNSSDGSIKKALDACVCAGHPRVFLGIDPQGRPCVVKTRGNPDTCIVLRGSYDTGPNDHCAGEAARMMREENMSPAVVVDCAHGNSGKTVEGQIQVFRRIDWSSVRGFMLESFLECGNQSEPERRGVSITDPCLGIAQTRELLLSSTMPVT